MKDLDYSTHGVSISQEKVAEQATENDYLLSKAQKQIMRELAKIKEENKRLEADLNQQRFNNKHNLSIDQKIADKIAELETENTRLRALVFHFTGEME